MLTSPIFVCVFNFLSDGGDMCNSNYFKKEAGHEYVYLDVVLVDHNKLCKVQSSHYVVMQVVVCLYLAICIE